MHTAWHWMNLKDFRIKREINKTGVTETLFNGDW
jgi:hypothetical protein